MFRSFKINVAESKFLLLHKQNQLKRLARLTLNINTCVKSIESTVFSSNKWQTGKNVDKSINKFKSKKKAWGNIRKIWVDRFKTSARIRTFVIRKHISYYREGCEGIHVNNFKDQWRQPAWLFRANEINKVNFGGVSRALLRYGETACLMCCEEKLNFS